jgi:uncharacterized paraquat-inducible protein A
MNNLNLNEPNSNQPTNTQNCISCPDCFNLVSKRAESCPHCGRFFQSFRLTEVIGRNWSLRIALGMILGYLVILVINAILFFTVGVFVLGVISNALNKTQPTPTVYK